MSKLNGRKVKMFKVQTIIHIPEVGQLNQTITPNASGKLGELQLTKEEDGVHVKGKTFEAFVPNGNICVIQFYNETNN